MSLHIEYCEGFGMTKEEMEATEESQGMLGLEAIHTTTDSQQHVQHTPGNTYFKFVDEGS
jgi:hypothetical protein